MRCCARNIERLTRIPKLRTDLQSRFVACSFLSNLGSMNSLAGPTLGRPSAMSNYCAFVQARWVVDHQTAFPAPMSLETCKGVFWDVGVIERFKA